MGEGRRGVEALRVLPHHAAREHLRSERAEGAADHLDPAARQARRVPVVEARRHLLLDQLVEGGRLQVVAAVLVGRLPVGGGDRPAEVRVVPLVPPAVADRQVEAAVQGGASSRWSRTPPGGAGGCSTTRRSPDRASAPWPCRSPAGRRCGGGRAGRRRTAPSPAPAACRRRRPGGPSRDHDLHRPLRVQQQLAEPVAVPEHQREPLVRGETRRAKPMVRTSGSRTWSIQPSSAAPAPRSRQEAPQPGPHLVDERCSRSARRTPRSRRRRSLPRRPSAGCRRR